ncbi:Ubiquitin carboxyl-terminal hydrolase 10 [Malassezia yamatoensis]|uniref:Ubiquitin carboxyl-terminal hydrolase 10 n=1 Tax=Malassezia yamatoensis TaxID=253288 RepID=A0AAJ5YPJ1_9BASI|nr:Ubiquitin carboxyl-terminal hydrolase 10 [Malassezia yamatoensis]
MSDDRRTGAEPDAKRARLEQQAEAKGKEFKQSISETQLPGAESLANSSSVRHDLYLDTINRSQLDFDFEKVCCVSLSNVNIYACLVCGKYFQGRGRKTPAYFHSINDEHHVFMNLSNARVYILPENYEVQDISLSDIQYQISITFSEKQIRQLDAPGGKISRTLHSHTYRPGFVGLNNMGASDAFNVVIQALAHVPPLRNYFLRGGTPAASRGNIEFRQGPVEVDEATGALLHSSELVKRFAMLIRRIWNPHSFKAQVSPHEFLQEIAHTSQGRFKLTEQADPVEFLGWLLNRLHHDLAGGSSAARKCSTIISRCFQGKVRVESQNVIVRTGLEEDDTIDKLDHDGRQKGGQQDQHGNAKFNIEQAISMNITPFLFLAVDLPPPPVFQDAAKENIIPQTHISKILSKFDGSTFQEANGVIRRFHLTNLPPYLILHFRRFTKNRFVEERNPTIVNFPTVGLDMEEYVESSSNDPPLETVYSLLANITHEATPGTVRENSIWRAQVHTRADGDKETASAEEERWFQMQDLIMDEVNKQILFLGESYIQVWERKNAVAEVENDIQRLTLARHQAHTPKSA